MRTFTYGDYLRLFRVEPEKKFVEYLVTEFKEDHKEEDLEHLLESNPGSMLEKEILVIRSKNKPLNMS